MITLRERLLAAGLALTVLVTSVMTLLAQRDLRHAETITPEKVTAFLETNRPAGDLNVLVGDFGVCLGAKGRQWDPGVYQPDLECWLWIMDQEGYSMVVKDKREPLEEAR